MQLSAARASIKSMEEQLQLLSISMNEGSRSGSSSAPQVHSNVGKKDDRSSEEQNITAVVGGLPTSSSEIQCTAWLVEKINELYSVKPTRVYSKGDFKGMLWLVFDSSAIRDGVVETTWKAKIAMHASQIWIAPDLPIEMRPENKFLFGFKRLLLTWG